MSEVVDFPVLLQNTFFTRFVVIPVAGHDPDKHQSLNLPMNNRIRMEVVDEVAGEYALVMRTILNEEEDPVDPYHIDIECVVVFKAVPGKDLLEVKKAVGITGHSIAYGAIREAVAWVTGRSAYPPLLLGISVLKKPTPPVDPPQEETPSPN